MNRHSREVKTTDWQPVLLFPKFSLLGESVASLHIQLLHQLRLDTKLTTNVIRMPTHVVLVLIFPSLLTLDEPLMCILMTNLLLLLKAFLSSQVLPHGLIRILAKPTY